MAAVVDALAGGSLRENFDLTVLNTGKMTPVGRPWRVAVWHQLRLFWTLGVMLARGHGRLVHIHTCSGLTFWRDTVFLLLARLFGRRVVWHVHGGGFTEFVDGLRGIPRTALGLAFSMSDAAIVLSESSRLRLSRYLKPRRWAIVENGVNLAPFRATAPASEMFLFVGTLDRAKGAEDLVAATGIAIRNGFKGRVELAGGETAPGQRARLQSLIARDGLVEHIEMLGIVSGPKKIAAFEAACAFVLPSYIEGMPLAMLEAMAYGLPVIVTDVGSIPEVVTDGVEGFLIKPGDLEALAECIMRLWTDPALRQRMGAAGRTRVKSGYTVDVMTARVADVYRATTEIR